MLHFGQSKKDTSSFLCKPSQRQIHHHRSLLSTQRDPHILPRQAKIFTSKRTYLSVAPHHRERKQSGHSSPPPKRLSAASLPSPHCLLMLGSSPTDVGIGCWGRLPHSHQLHEHRLYVYTHSPDSRLLFITPHRSYENVASTSVLSLSSSTVCGKCNAHLLSSIMYPLNALL